MSSNVPGGVHVLAVPGPGQAVALGRLAHGQHPETLLYAAGWAAGAPVAAALGPGGALELSYAVTEPSGIPPQAEEPRRDPDLPPGATGEPLQRVAAYAVVTSPRGVLLTQFTARTNVAGQWGLPGGGLEPGEAPEAGVLREVWEETGQQVTLGRLVEVQSRQWVGRSPARVVQDFHAIAIVYRAHCADPTEPVVHDVGGTTGDARWVAPDQLRELPLAASWARVETLVRSETGAP